MTGVIDVFNYGAAISLLLYGLYSILAQNHLTRKVIGMVILQTGVILFFVSVSVKSNAKIPILPDEAHHVVDPAQFANPLPHALMLTAIVVGVSTLGVALVLLVSIFDSYGTLEEDEILKETRRRP